MNIDTILEYATAGIAVGPLHTMIGNRCTCRKNDCRVLLDGTIVGAPAKHPRTAHGKDDFTTNPVQIREWADQWPDANWGGRPPVGAIVVDVDPRNQGDETMLAFKREHGPLPETLTARTGSNGWHIWLSYNGPTRGKLGRGVDVKTNSGYVVLPPSLHASGRRYEWVNRSPAAYAPEWVRDILNPPIPAYIPSVGAGSTSIDGLVRFITNSPPGEINDQFFWACCRCLDNGLDINVLTDTALALGRPFHKVKSTAESAMKTDRQPPRRLSVVPVTR